MRVKKCIENRFNELNIDNISLSGYALYKSLPLKNRVQSLFYSRWYSTRNIGICTYLLVGWHCISSFLAGQHDTCVQLHHAGGSIVKKNHLLIQARETFSWTQQDLADQVDVTKMSVGRWERGETIPHRAIRQRLCALFDKTEMELGWNEAEVSEDDTQASRSIYDPAIPLLPSIHLVGRTQEIAHVKHRLCAADGTTVALTATALNGIPGVGKTALAITLAHDIELRTRFADGVLWAALGPQPNIHSGLNRWGTLLGISTGQMAALSSIEAKAQALHSAIGTRSLLIIIDDAWTLEDAMAFKIGGPYCSHLLTTRFPRIATHLCVHPTLIEELSEDESMTLLKLLTPVVVDREPGKALDLVRAVGGLPLALTLVGNYLRKQAYSGQPRRITAAFEHLYNDEERLSIGEPHVLAEAHPSLPPRTPLSLESVLTVTNQRLSESARLALYALSIFPAKPNAFSEEAALAVAACQTDDLDELTDAGFLEYSGERYRLHQVIADYARLHITGQDERAAYDRLFRYIIAYSEAHTKEYAALERESAVLFAALELAHKEERWSELARILHGAMPFLLARGFYTLADHYVQQTYTHSMQSEGGEQGPHGIMLLLYRGLIAKEVADFAQARIYLLEGFQRARQAGEQRLMCEMLAALGNVIWRVGEHTQALAYLQEGIALARHIHDDDVLCESLRVLGAVLSEMGEYVQATTSLEEAWQLTQQQKHNDESAASILLNLGVVYSAQGDYDRAETYFQEALQLARRVGHRETTCLLLHDLGQLRLDRDADAEAEPYFQEALQLARQLGLPEWTSVSLTGIGTARARLGDYNQAEVYLQEGLDMARHIGRPRMIANALYAYGDFALIQQPPDITAASGYFQEMSSLLSLSTPDPETIGLTYYGLARVAAARSDWHTAYEYGAKSYAVLAAKGHVLAKKVHAWLMALPQEMKHDMTEV